MAAIEKIQKKTASQPDKIIADCQLPIADLKFCRFTLLTSERDADIRDCANIFVSSSASVSNGSTCFCFK